MLVVLVFEMNLLIPDGMVTAVEMTASVIVIAVLARTSVNATAADGTIAGSATAVLEIHREIASALRLPSVRRRIRECIPIGCACLGVVGEAVVGVRRGDDDNKYCMQ
jgi:hypothetical protein